MSHRVLVMSSRLVMSKVSVVVMSLMSFFIVKYKWLAVGDEFPLEEFGVKAIWW